MPVAELVLQLDLQVYLGTQRNKSDYDTMELCYLAVQPGCLLCFALRKDLGICRTSAFLQSSALFMLNYCEFIKQRVCKPFFNTIQNDS